MSAEGKWWVSEDAEPLGYNTIVRLLEERSRQVCNNFFKQFIIHPAPGIGMRGVGSERLAYPPIVRYHSSSARTIASVKVTGREGDRKSTRLNSSHQIISYAVFCLKKKNIVDRVHGEKQRQCSTT